ncbi:hypothetical protein GBAR_LOCUS17810, partial [Geodia barretti]
MEDRPTTIRVYPGELRPVYYTSVLASQTTATLEVIRLALERLQIFEDKTLYELHEGCPGDEDNWDPPQEGGKPRRQAVLIGAPRTRDSIYPQ